MEKNEEKKILVLGVGNDLLKDEGIGVHVIRAMEELSLPANVSLVNGGVGGIDLLDEIKGAGRLIIVDAMDAGAQPGAVFRFRAEEVDVIIGEHKTSLHQVDLFDTLKLARFLGFFPETVIIAVQPQDISWGMAPTPVLASRMPLIIDIVKTEIQAFMN